MRYDFHCSACDAVFEAQAAIERRDEPRACRECGADAGRVFNPHTIHFNMSLDDDRIHGGTSFGVSDNERCLLGIDPALHHDVNHSANYHLGKKRADRQGTVDAFFAKRKPRKSIEQRMREKYPDMRLDGPVGKGSAAFLRQTLKLEK